MLRLPSFEYVAAATVADAAAALQAHGADAMLMAGGTDMLPKFKRRQFKATVIIGLKRVAEMHGIQGDRHTGLRIGALVTLREIANHPEIRAGYTALAEAAAAVGTGQIRATGTLGGNLCLDTRCDFYDQLEDWRKAIDYCMKCDGTICRVAPSSARCVATSSTDTAPAVIALGGRVRLVSARGEREIDADGLYREDGMHYLAKEPDEILTQIILPPSIGQSSTYLKLRRRDSFDFPVLGVAAAHTPAADGTVANLGLVLGAVASRPLTVTETSEAIGRVLDDERIEALAAAAGKRAKPMDNVDLALIYRKRMTQVYTRRALAAVSGR